MINYYMLKWESKHDKPRQIIQLHAVTVTMTAVVAVVVAVIEIVEVQVR